MPIYLRLTVDSKRIEMYTQRECEPSKWNKNSLRVMGTTKEIQQVNSYLDILKVKIYEAQRELLNAGEDVTVTSIRNKLIGKEERKKSLLEVYRYHIEQIKELVGKEYAAGTLKRFKAALSSLEAFIKWKYKVEDISLYELSFQFITEYEFFLKSERNIQHNTAMGIIKKLKQIVRTCVANEWIDKDPFMNYRVRLRETHRSFLLENELEIITEKALLGDRLNIVRDIFLFSCFTGLSYSDVEKLTSADVATGIDGEKWIFTSRTKTETASRIPLLPTALAIIIKYEQHPKVANTGRLLPMLSNQRMNSYLKELAEICGIKKELTFHCARHTFATTVTLTNGVPIESVSKMLGHKTIRTTQLYAKILDKKVSEDMSVLRQRFAKGIEGKKINKTGS